MFRESAGMELFGRIGGIGLPLVENSLTADYSVNVNLLDCPSYQEMNPWDMRNILIFFATDG